MAMLLLIYAAGSLTAFWLAQVITVLEAIRALGTGPRADAEVKDNTTHFGG